MDELTSRLRLMVWYKHPEEMEGMVVFRRRTMDFGDSISAWVIRIIQVKLLAMMCKLDLANEVILSGAHSNNYNSSFRSRQEYLDVKQDMEEIHEQIGLPMKNTTSLLELIQEYLQDLGKMRNLIQPTTS